MDKLKTINFISITDVMVLTNLDNEERETLVEALCDGEATYGANMHSLVSGQYICETIMEQLNEEWSGRMLDKMQRFLLDCDDKDIAFDLEG